MNTKKHLIILVAAFSMIFSSSCASYLVNKESAKQVAMRKALITNDEPAMKALRNGEDVAASGIDVTAWEAAKERPLLSLFAGAVDVGTVVAGYKGIQKIDDGSNGSDKEPTQIGGDQINIKGDSNTVNLTRPVEVVPVTP